MPTDPVKRGFYLATIAHCMECHSRKPEGGQDYKGSWGKGGQEMKGPFGSIKVSNITAHKEKGIGHDGRTFKLPMARQIYFSKLTEQDLNAIVAWVRTIPAAE